MQKVDVSERVAQIKGLVEIECIRNGEVFYREVDEFKVQNLIVNLFRQYLPLLISPKLITGRADNSPGVNTWIDRRICLIGFGIGDGGDPPSVRPEDPEDGRTLLVGESDYPNSKLGLQGPIRRVPLTPTGPSEVNLPVGAGDPVNEDINGYYLLKEVDADGVSVVHTPGGGSEVTFTFTVEEDEYIGNIMEYGLYMGGGEPTDTSTYEVEPGVYEVRRLDRENAIMVARKTRNKPLEKTRDFKIRVRWRIRT